AGDDVSADDARERAADRRARGAVVDLVARGDRRRQRRRRDVGRRRRRRRRQRVVARLRAAQRQVARRDRFARADGGGVEAAGATERDDVGADHARQRAADGRGRRGVVGLVRGRNRRRQRRRGDVGRRRRGGRGQRVVAGLRAAERQRAARDGLARADGGGVEAARAAAGDDVGADHARQRAADGRGRRGVVGLVR